MYPTRDKIEQQQVEWVFGLTGGELSDRPLRFAEVTYDPGLKGVASYPPSYKIKRWWRRYFYDGQPDYVRQDCGATYITIVACCLFGELPKKIITGGKVWRRVAVYTHSGEAECPEHGNIVTEDQAKEPVGVTGIAPQCVLCNEPVGSKHGFIYLGDGWAEVVYRSRS